MFRHAAEQQAGPCSLGRSEGVAVYNLAAGPAHLVMLLPLTSFEEAIRPNLTLI